jgi:hypothetical protein
MPRDDQNNGITLSIAAAGRKIGTIAQRESQDSFSVLAATEQRPSGNALYGLLESRGGQIDGRFRTPISRG